MHQTLGVEWKQWIQIAQDMMYWPIYRKYIECVLCKEYAVIEI